MWIAKQLSAGRPKYGWADCDAWQRWVPSLCSEAQLDGWELPKAPMLTALPIPLLALQAPGTMGTAEDAAWLRWVTERFQSIAGHDEEIGLEEFKAALQVKEVSAGPCMHLHLGRFPALQLCGAVTAFKGTGA